MISIRHFIEKLMSSTFLVLAGCQFYLTIPNKWFDLIQHTIQVIDEYFVLVVHFSIIFYSLFVVDVLTNAHTVSIFLLYP